MMKLPDFLVYSPDGPIRVTGRRIGLLDIVDRYNAGDAPEAMSEDYDLALGIIQKVIAFYRDNRAEVDAYVAECHAAIERFEANYRPSPAELRMRRLLERIRQADAARASDPEWSALSIVDKARRLEAESPSETK
jgi:uncharacterized protein (DUF433 family)